MSVGKKDVSDHSEQQKPPVLEHRGFSIPFWVGGLSPRLTTISRLRLPGAVVCGKV